MMEVFVLERSLALKIQTKLWRGSNKDIWLSCPGWDPQLKGDHLLGWGATKDDGQALKCSVPGPNIDPSLTESGPETRVSTGFLEMIGVLWFPCQHPETVCERTRVSPCVTEAGNVLLKKTQAKAEKGQRSDSHKTNKLRSLTKQTWIIRYHHKIPSVMSTPSSGSPSDESSSRTMVHSPRENNTTPDVSKATDSSIRRGAITQFQSLRQMHSRRRNCKKQAHG